MKFKIYSLFQSVILLLFTEKLFKTFHKGNFLFKYLAENGTNKINDEILFNTESIKLRASKEQKKK